MPEREYALDLRDLDARKVAQSLVILSAEPGENLQYTTYNGLPFEVGALWIDAVPVVGFFCGYFHTPPGCAVLALRLGLARRLLMPGHGRWKVIPKAHRNPNEDPFSAEASIGLEHMVIDADGSLIEKPPEQVAETLSVGGLLGVLRFKTKLKRKAAKRLAKVQYQKVDLVKSAPLSVIVALSLKAQRAQAKTKSSKADDASKAVRGASTVCRSLSVT